MHSGAMVHIQGGRRLTSRASRSLGRERACKRAWILPFATAMRRYLE